MRAAQRVLGGIAAAAGLVGGSLAFAPSASAATFERIAGSDRYSTAVAVSRSAFPDPVATVFVATGLGYADALAGGPAAATANAPMLLVSQDAVPASTREEVTRLKPNKIVILGGPGAVSVAVEEQLKALAATVARIQGTTRYETAANTSASAFAPGVAVAYVGSGTGFADALAGGPAAVQRGGPVLLTERNTLPSATRTELQRLAPTSIVVLGGTAAVSAEVETQLRGIASSVRRDASYDRYATAVAVSKQAFVTTPVPLVYLATGASFPDALAAGAAAGRQRVPLLLTGPDCIPASVNSEINRLQAARIVLLGGTSAISKAVESGVVCPEAGVSRLGTDRRNVAYNLSSPWPTGARSIAGTRYNEAISLQVASGRTASYNIDFDIARDFGTFRAAVGQGDDSTDTAETVEFRLIGDGVLLKSSRIAFGQVEMWDVNVVNVLRLRLEAQIVTSDGQNGSTRFAFGNPRVLR